MKLSLLQYRMLIASLASFSGARDHFNPPPRPSRPDVPEVVAWYRRREAEQKARKRNRGAR